MQGQGRRLQLASIIDRDGAWYVVEGKKAGKYRRFEAPLDLPTVYLYILRAELRFAVLTDRAGIGTFEDTNGGIASFRTPFPQAQRRYVEAMIANWEKVNQGKTAVPAGAETGLQIKKMKDLASNGILVRVELASRMIVEYGSVDRRTQISDFRWREQVDGREFATDGIQWGDYTDDPTAGNLMDLVTIGHSGAWRPGAKSHEIDGRLLDLETGRYRRTPFLGINSYPGCFLKDRTRVVVAGLDAINGVLGLHEVNLKTGENRQLGGELLASGTTLGPALSPDGRWLAALHVGAPGGVLGARVCIVDLQTGNAKHVGDPCDIAFLSWPSDGKGLLIRFRQPGAEPNKTTIAKIARMDVEGRITMLLEGDMPALIGDNNTILFLKPETRTWHTCDLNGKNMMLYADGLAGYSFPAPAPDGKRLMMMRLQPQKKPEPFVFPLGTSLGKLAVDAPGLWATPAWQ